MKRFVASVVLVFASGLMTIAGVLPCFYCMPGCDMTPGCPQHQQTLKLKPASCCDGFATGQKTISTEGLRYTFATETTVSTATPCVVMGCVPTFVVTTHGASSPPILNLRV